MGRADGQAEDNLFGISGEDFVCHGVSDVFGNANKVTAAFTGFGQEGAVMDVVEDVFPPVEVKQWADIVCRASKTSQRDIMVGPTDSVVQDETDVKKAEEPGGSGRTGAVK